MGVQVGERKELARDRQARGRKAKQVYAAQTARYQAYLGLTDAPALFTAINTAIKEDTCEISHEFVPVGAERAGRERQGAPTSERLRCRRTAAAPYLPAELNELLADDIDLSLVGFSDGEIDKLPADVPEGEGDGEDGAGGGTPPVVIPEPPRNPASRTGDPWILGDHRLLCGDSTSHADVRRLMNGERAALFATDPPYLVDYVA